MYDWLEELLTRGRSSRKGSGFCGSMERFKRFPITVIDNTMAVSADLPEELASFVEEEVDRGRYNSKSELLRDALRLKMMNRKLDTGMIRGETVERLKAAVESVEDGKVYSAEEVKERHLE